MADSATNDTTDLETIGEDGKAPKTRIKCASKAWSILKKLIDRDDVRSKKRAKVQGQVDGNAPHSLAALKRTGQGGKSNVNFREAESALNARKTSYYELLMEVESLVTITLAPSAKNPSEVVDAGAIIADEFSNMMMEWPGFWYNMLLHQKEFVMWGVGNCYWEDETDWRFKAARMGSFLVPDGTNSDMDDLDIVAIRRGFKIHELFEYVKDEDAIARSKAGGWNTDLIKTLIGKAACTGSDRDKWQLGQWESLQQEIKDNDLAYSYAVSEKVKVSNILIKEFDGSITHVIIPEDEQYNKTSSTGEPAPFLFQKISRYNAWEECVRLFFVDIGDGSYHSVRGLGPKIYASCVLSDRLMNMTVDGAITAATILVEPGNAAQTGKVRMVRIGGFTVMPSGFNVVPTNNFKPDFQGLAGVKGLLDAQLNRNVGLQRPQVTETDKTPSGQTQAELRSKATSEAKLEKADIGMYYVQWDGLYKEVLRRVLNPDLLPEDSSYKSVQKFKKACKDRGVPESLLKRDLLLIEAKRAIGFGSPLMKSLITADLLSVSAYFDEVGRKNIVQDYTGARAGQVGVNRYCPTQDRNKIPSSEHTIASLENNDLKEGSDVIVAVDQPHVIHLLVHMKPQIEMVQAYVDGKIQDIQGLYTYLGAGLQHDVKHMDYIAADPARQGDYAQFKSQLDQMFKIYSQLEGEIQAMAKEQEAQAMEQQRILEEAKENAGNEKLQIELAKIQADTQIKVFKEQNNDAIRKAKAAHSMQIKEALARQEMRLNAATAATE